MPRAKLFTTVAIFFVCVSEASAGFMTVQHLFPGSGDVQFQDTFEVGPGVDLEEFHTFAYRDLNVESEPTGFTFSLGMNHTFTFNDVPGNALRLIDSDDMFSTIVSVDLLDTNISGFDASRISFDDDSLTLRFAGLQVTPQSFVSVEANAEPNVAAVPEPSSLLLVGVGISMFFFSYLRGRQARHLVA